MSEKNKSYMIVELSRLSPIERDLVNRFLQMKSPASRAMIMEGMYNPPEQPAMSRAISSLVEKKIILRTGRTSGSRFALNPEARHFATPPQIRPPVPFDPFRIEAYIPNKTQWLPKQIRDQMAHAAEGMRGKLDANTYSQQIAERFMIDFSWASSHLEGNSCDILNAELLLKYGALAGDRDHSEVIMLLNHKRAINHMLEKIKPGIPNCGETRRLHVLMMNELMDPYDTGCIRNRKVRISSSCYIPSGDQTEISGQQEMIMTRAAEIINPFEASFFLLASTSYLQAFRDGNKRMGRLLSNAPLLKSGMPPLSFVNIDRTKYILGLIDFYETSNTKLLAHAVSENYILNAPYFEATHATYRIPHRLEIEENQRIAKCVHDIIEDGVDFPDIEGRVNNLFENRNKTTREEITMIIHEKLKCLDPMHSVIYDLEDDQIINWIKKNTQQIELS